MAADRCPLAGLASPVLEARLGAEKNAASLVALVATTTPAAWHANLFKNGNDGHHLGIEVPAPNKCNSGLLGRIEAECDPADGN